MKSRYSLSLSFKAHNKGINALIMLPEGTLLSGGEKDRKIIAWDSLQNYIKITETKVIVALIMNLVTVSK